MPNLLQRLYRTTLALIATTLTFAGAGLMCAAQWSDWTWLDNSLIRDLGSTMFGTGLLAVVFDYFVSRQADQISKQSLRAVVIEQTPAIGDAVINAQAMRPDLARRIAPQALDRIIENAMAVRLDDADLARDAYTDLREQLTRARIRRYNLDVTATLTPWPHGPDEGFGSMFVATVRSEYRTSNLPAELKFSAVSDQAHYRNLLQDDTNIEACLFDVKTVPIDHPDAYQLVQCDINGRPQLISHEKTNKSQTFTVRPAPMERSSGDINVTYTVRTLVSRHGHLFFLDFGAARGLRVNFTHTADCGIAHVSFLDFIASAQQVRVTRSHDLPQGIRISFDGWALPRSGAAFVWVLDREVAVPSHRLD
jgi:hypothetical protein